MDCTCLPELTAARQRIYNEGNPSAEVKRLMNRYFRVFMLLVCAVQLFFAAAFILRFPPVLHLSYCQRQKKRVRPIRAPATGATR